MTSLISVIIPVYNVEKYVERCLLSVINQTYKNLEIIIVNDGSTDNSEEICKNISKTDNRVSLYSKQNGGLSDARNFGIKKSNGEYLSFIDSDDYISLDFYEQMMLNAKKYKADIVASDILFFSSEDEINSLNKNPGNYETEVLNGDKAIINYLSHTKKIYHGLCMKIYKKNLFDGLRFEKDKLHEDLYITYQLLYKSKQYVIIKHQLYYYFQNNDNSISNNYGVKNFKDECEAMFRIVNFFEKTPYVKEACGFASVSFFNAFYKAATFLNNTDLCKYKEHVCSWVRNHIFDCNNIKIYKKLEIYYYIKHIDQYINAKEKYEKIKKVLINE